MEKIINLAKINWVFLLLALCGGLCFASGEEWVLNGGFESGSGATPSYWASRGQDGWAVWKDEDWGQTGEWFVCAGGGDGSDYQEWYQTITVTADVNCVFSVESRTENWGLPTGYIKIVWKNGSGSTIDSHTETLFTGSKNTTWSQYSTGELTVPANAMTAEVVLHGGISGTILFDQVSVCSTLPDADFNNDLHVDYNDFAELANTWQQSSTQYDLTGDDFVNNNDLKLFTDHWLETTECPLLVIDDSQSYQQIDGFGASLTDSSAYIVNYLTASERASVLEELFDPVNGIGLSYLRQPMGSSDFRLRDYSYDDMPSGETDYDLSEFSIAYDLNYIVPVLQDILAISPDVKIMGSPWSAPAWMKTSAARGWGSLIDDDRIYETYANYFVKYIQAYEGQGLTIDAVTFQNEPHYEPYSYPGMHMEPADQIRLAKEMGPAFEANSIDTKIFCWDHNWDDPDYPIAVLADANAYQYIEGTAWHHYSGNISAQTTVHNSYPNKSTYFTEGSDGEWNDDGFDQDLIGNANFVVECIRNWAQCIVKWNLILDQNNGPKISGGCDTCYGVITVNSSSHLVSRRPHYYALGQISKFVRPGAVRIESTESPKQGLKNVAFKNLDNSIVCFIVNENSSTQELKIDWGVEAFIYTLPGRSVSTFIWQQGSSTVDVWITTGGQSKLLEQQPAIPLD